MSCHGCASKFSLFSKEQGCPSCDFSFCSKCLKYKAVVAGKGTKPTKVCSTCHHKLSNSQQSSTGSEIDPPALLLKRLEALENPARPPITLFHNDQKLRKLKHGLSIEDKEIVDRLEKLKEDRLSRQVAPTSDDEIKQRLAVLQGKDVTVQQMSNVPKPDTRLDQEKVDDLLDEYIQKDNLDTIDVLGIGNIETRLKALRSSSSGKEQSKEIHDVNSDSEDESVAAERLVQQVLEEAELGLNDMAGLPTQHQTDLNTKSAEWEPNESELPWCIICNEDASLRCLSCDGDLYCARCFREGHDTFDMNHHKPCPYKTSHQS